MGGPDRIPAGLVHATDGEGAGVRRDRAGQHVHERRLAGSVVTDQADALTGFHLQIDTAQGANSTIGFLDADKIGQARGLGAHGDGITASGSVDRTRG